MPVIDLSRCLRINYLVYTEEFSYKHIFVQKTSKINSNISEEKYYQTIYW